MSIQWSPNTYVRISPDLGLRTAFHEQAEPPNGWASNKAYRAQEETLQTLFSLHLEKVCGERVRLIGKAGDAWDEADIYGLDPIGRIHLFELKRDTINFQAARQMSHYLLRQIFADPTRFIDRWWKRMGEGELEPQRLAVALAGALAGERTDTIGFSFLQAWGCAAGMQEHAWEQLKYSEKHRPRLEALLAKAKTRLIGIPSAEEVLADAAKWRSRLWPQTTLPAGRFRCESPVVIWLAGTSVSSDAEKEIHHWRAQGVDARCLQAEVRFSSERDGLLLRLAREVAPGRANLMEQLEEWQAPKDAPNAPPRLQLDLYEKARPSDSAVEKQKERWPKVPPSATLLDTGDVITGRCP